MKRYLPLLLVLICLTGCHSIPGPDVSPSAAPAASQSVPSASPPAAPSAPVPTPAVPPAPEGTTTPEVTDTPPAALPERPGYAFTQMEETRYFNRSVYVGSWAEDVDSGDRYANSLYLYDSATGTYSLLLEPPCAYPVLLSSVGDYYDVVFTATSDAILAYDAATMALVDDLSYETNLNLFGAEDHYASAYLIGWDETRLALCIDRYRRGTQEWIGFQNYLYDWSARTLEGPYQDYWDLEQDESYYAYLAEFEHGPLDQGDICTINGYTYRWYHCAYTEPETDTEHRFTLLYREKNGQRVRAFLLTGYQQITFPADGYAAGEAYAYFSADNGATVTHLAIQANSGRIFHTSQGG